jgi:hypothetical protein
MPGLHAARSGGVALVGWSDEEDTYILVGRLAEPELVGLARVASQQN